jgi:hypothetical protein
MFIPDPGFWFFPSWIQSSKKHRIPDLQRCRQYSKKEEKYHVREGRSRFYRQESIEVGCFLIFLKRYIDFLQKIVYLFLHRHCNQNTGSPPAMIVKKLCIEIVFLFNNEKLIYIYQPWKWYKNEFSSTILQSSLLLALTCSYACQTNTNYYSLTFILTYFIASEAGVPDPISVLDPDSIRSMDPGG